MVPFYLIYMNIKSPKKKPNSSYESYRRELIQRVSQAENKLSTNRTLLKLFVQARISILAAKGNKFHIRYKDWER